MPTETRAAAAKKRKASEAVLEVAPEASMKKQKVAFQKSEELTKVPDKKGMKNSNGKAPGGVVAREQAADKKQVGTALDQEAGLKKRMAPATEHQNEKTTKKRKTVTKKKAAATKKKEPEVAAEELSVKEQVTPIFKLHADIHAMINKELHYVDATCMSLTCRDLYHHYRREKLPSMRGLIPHVSKQWKEKLATLEFKEVQPAMMEAAVNARQLFGDFEKRCKLLPRIKDWIFENWNGRRHPYRYCPQCYWFYISYSGQSRPADCAECKGRWRYTQLSAAVDYRMSEAK